MLDGARRALRPPGWERRLDPTSELILTILTQNTADTNAEVAFEALRRAYPGGRRRRGAPPGRRLGRRRPAGRRAAGLGAPSSSRRLDELIDVIRPGGLANQKAPRLQATLRTIREERGDYSLEFLGDMPALEARDWLDADRRHRQEDRLGPAAVLFGLPLMPIDRHVERVMRRVGLLPPKAIADEAHDLVLALLEPDQMYEAHVNLIHHGRKVCHAQRPDHERARSATRCRFVDPKAP